MRIANSFLLVFNANSNVYDMVRWWVNKSGMLLFYMVMLRLKKLEIYLNPENNTDAKIAASLATSKCLITLFVLGCFLLEICLFYIFFLKRGFFQLPAWID